MILRRFYDDKLAQASYLIGCAATGEALVVDANRDVAQYLDAATSEGLRVTDVTETHIHADYVSGSRELARAAGARLWLSDEGGPDWRYGFAAAEGARLLHDGDTFKVGNIRIDVLHTPGHTPEHLSFLVTDTAGADRPMGILTGDFVFVGAVGRPDLLEKAAGLEGTMEAGARDLFRSLQRFRALPDWLQVWPGHGAGSACGKALGAVPQTTVGYERLFNLALTIDSEDEFVDYILADQPEPPRYFAEMKRINRDGPRVLGGFARPPRLEAAALEELLARGARIADLRPQAEFEHGHVPGTISIPQNKSFTTWAGWLLPYDADFYLILPAGCESCIDEAVRDLAMIGRDRIAGYFAGEVVRAVPELERTPRVSASELAAQLASGDVAIVDVRGAAEFAAGHLPGGRNIPLGYLEERLAAVPRDRPVVVHCQSGARSAIGASLLLARGYRDVRNLAGGLDAWAAAGEPVERDGAPTPA
ncbi:MAG TPA: MBL fold metallo-hydrolase [Longimicrobiales bacterium]|nr:MBL fold metallo-hydrolase [Longimicrobiales bacterium]